MIRTEEIPRTCPECGFESPDASEMVRHFFSHQLTARGDGRLYVRGGGGTVRTITAENPPLVKEPFWANMSLDDLVRRKDTLPWWLGLGLIAMALTIPGTRSMMLRLVHIAIQVIAWAMVIIASLAAVLVWAVVYWGPRLASWASVYWDRFWMAP